MLNLPMGKGAKMGLLKMDERKKLISFLSDLPTRNNPVARRQLYTGIPRHLQNLIPDDPAPSIHFTNIVNTVDDEAWDEPYEGSWPVIQVIDNAIFQVGSDAPVGQKLNVMLNDLKSRAQQWASLNTLSNVRPQEPFEFERVMSEKLGFHDPVRWSAQMQQVMLAVCLIEFENAYPKAQGTGFLLGPSVVMTNYHVMEQVIQKQVKPEEVVLRFNYMTGSEGSEYRLAADWNIDFSQENMLDYALLRVAGTPGKDSVESLPDTPVRKWLTPQVYSFQAGEPLFIIQHPNGERLKFAFDTIKTLTPTMISYRTNTDHGSSGSPCLTINWQLVALHQGSLSKTIDPEAPNKGIPFAAILKESKVKGALGT
jgi:Trypsin-like peptidase domain